jgi:hypothetical protein
MFVCLQSKFGYGNKGSIKNVMFHRDVTVIVNVTMLSFYG